jgi:hypothetical protein
MNEPYTEPMAMVEFGECVSLPLLLETMAAYIRELGKNGVVWDVTIAEHASEERPPSGLYWAGRLFVAFRD